MAVVRAVRALRYDTARVGDLSRVIAPPYDVITPDEQAALYDASPYNVIRLILPREAARAEAASQTLREWMASGVLVREPNPAVYLYAQTFTLPDGSTRTREGVILSLGLEEFSRGIVLPHEKTLPGPGSRTRMPLAVQSRSAREAASARAASRGRMSRMTLYGLASYSAACSSGVITSYGGAMTRLRSPTRAVS